MKRIRVLHISNQLGLGGTDGTLQVLATHLNKQYFDVFALGIQSGGPREQVLRDRGIPTVVALGNLDTVSNFIRTHDIDVVHLHHCHVPLYVLSGRQIVLTHQFSRSLYPLDQEIKFPRLLFNSTRTLQKYLSTYNVDSVPSNTEIIYNPIDLAEIDQTQRSLTEDAVIAYRRRLGINSGNFVIGRLGRADIVKWSDFLTEACRPLIRSDPNVKVLIQTAPPSRIKSLKAEFGENVVILPESSSLRELALFFAAIDVYAHASKIGESFGVSIAEAMAFKKPVVVNSTPHADNAQIELVDNSKTGYVVNYPANFVQALERLRADRQLSREMGEAGYNKVKAKYAADVVTSQYERILLDLLNLSGRADLKEYAQSLGLPMTRAEMLNCFEEYERRLTQTFGSTSRREIARYWLREPARLLKRVSDYAEFRKQVKAQRMQQSAGVRRPGRLG